MLIFIAFLIFLFGMLLAFNPVRMIPVTDRERSIKNRNDAMIWKSGHPFD